MMTRAASITDAISALTLAEPQAVPVSAGAPLLTHELVESILVATAHFIQHQRIATAKPSVSPSVKSTTNLGQRRVFVRRLPPPSATPSDPASGSQLPCPAAKRPVLLSRLALVTSDIRPVHRYLLPLLPHAWPPAVAIAGDRADVLQQAHSLGLLDRWFALQPVDQHAQLRESLIVLAGNNAHILAWFQHQWPLDFQSFCTAHAAKIQHALVHAAVSSTSNGTELLDFWAHKSGIDLAGSGILPPQSAKDALMYAFRAQHVPLLYWWGDHTTLLASKDGGSTQQGDAWDSEWVEYATRYGHHGVLEACIELQEVGKVWFVKSRDRELKISVDLDSDADSAGETQPAAVSLPTESAVLSSVMTLGLDEASMAGRISSLDRILRRLTERGDAPLYSEAAMDFAHSADVLDWWATKSGLPLKYSKRALHEATIRRDTSILDWWLAAFRSGTVVELKYDEWIMAYASAAWKLDAQTGKPAAACIMGNLDAAAKVEILEWWDKSGLDLKLPGLQDIAARGVPSPIDICLDVPVLQFWLARAQRLFSAAASPSESSPSLLLLPSSSSSPAINIRHFFPQYTQVAMHRAAYWNATPALEWWFKVASPAGLPLRYSSHRIVELGAMSRSIATCIHNRTTSLELLFKVLPDIRFRGSLIDWAQRAGYSATLTVADEAEMALAADFVRRLCKSRTVNAVTGGGMGPWTFGHYKNQPGEAFVHLEARLPR